MKNQPHIVWLVLLFISCFAPCVTAQGPLPSIPGPINYDPIGASPIVIAKGGRSVRVTDSANGGSVAASNLGSVPLGGDNNDLPSAPWNWEFLITNLTTSVISVPCVIGLPNGKTLVGNLKIDPPSATSTGSEYFNLIIDEPTEGIFGGADITQGNFYVTITPPKRGFFEPTWLSFDTSIVEEIGNVELRSTNFDPRPGLPFLMADALTISVDFQGVGQNLDSPVGNMGLAINGIIPSAAGINHIINAAAGDAINLELSSAAPQQNFILLADNIASGGSTNLPWGGTLDLANPVIILNGIQPLTPFDSMAVSDFVLSAAVECTQTGSSWPALQAIYQEASLPPYFLNHTQVGKAVFPTTVKKHYSFVADDGFVQHDLCGTIDYLGVSYTSFYICANGQITFAQGVTGFTPNAVEFFNGFQAQVSGNSVNPGVSPIWTDLNNSSTFGDWITVTENTLNNVTDIRFMNQSHWVSTNAAGSWLCSFGSLGPNSVVFDIGAYIPGVTNSDDDPITGVTDGNNPIIGGGINSIVDFSAIIGVGYSTTPGTAPESIMEQFALAGNDIAAPFDLSILSFDDPTGTGLWTIF